ncbi:MAG: tRNA-specific adenosine deaminase subunit tad3 [Chrysothrix sp. TS-e1954]|nr:MAG: tRNA-specific adenosine deaminase subunit tad3 [Chrysothrix sp. TS-e1954]
MTSSLVALDIKPLNGHLVSLSTKREIENRDKTIDVYTATIPAKSSSAVVALINRIPNNTTTSLIHLRRFTKSHYLPEHLRTSTPNDSLHVILAPASLLRRDELKSLLTVTLPFQRFEQSRDTTTSAIDADLQSPDDNTAEIRTIPVPLYPPTSRVHAQALSARYWPTIFTNSNPLGPPPADLVKAHAAIKDGAGSFMALAQMLGREARETGCGVGAGAVVVERAKGKANVLVGAGDGRWVGRGRASGEDLGGEGDVRRGTGHIPGHATMRAIALVARKRRKVARRHKSAEPMSDRSSGEDQEGVSIFVDKPLTPLESQLSNQENLDPGGYLCLGLEMYVSHEPCVMCSMALVHSRFGKAVVGERMVKTGGVFGPELVRDQYDSIVEGSSESRQVERGLGYGMFWREDLNWRFPAWQWVSDHQASENESMEETKSDVADDIHI